MRRGGSASRTAGTALPRVHTRSANARSSPTSHVRYIEKLRGSERSVFAVQRALLVETRVSQRALPNIQSTASGLQHANGPVEARIGHSRPCAQDAAAIEDGHYIASDAVPASASILFLASCSSRWSVKTWAMNFVCSRVSGGAASRIFRTCSACEVRPNARSRSETRTRVLMAGHMPQLSILVAATAGDKCCGIRPSTQHPR